MSRRTGDESKPVLCVAPDLCRLRVESLGVSVMHGLGVILRRGEVWRCVRVTHGQGVSL
ncbi:hypothetical protein GCM10027408_08380 [Microbacterium tumbae]